MDIRSSTNYWTQHQVYRTFTYLQGFFSVFWEMAFFVCLGIFHRQKSNFGKITLCSHSINIDVIVFFILFITTLRASIQCHIFISVYLDYWSLAYQWLFLYVPLPPPPFFFLLKYYCAMIQYHTNCNKSYLCNLQQKNDVLSICTMVQLYIAREWKFSTNQEFK